MPAASATTVDLIWFSTTGAGIPGGTSIAAAPGDVLELDVVVTTDPIGAHFISLSLQFDAPVLAATGFAPCPESVVPSSCPDPVFTFLSPFGPGSMAASLAADFDANGAVGASDFALFAPNFATTVPPTDPIYDLNNDGLVGIPDYAIVLSELGSPGVTGIGPGLVQMFGGHTNLGNAWFGFVPPAPTVLARITLEVTGASPGPSQITPFFLPKIDGYVDGAFGLIADSNNPTGIVLNTAQVNVPPDPTTIHVIQGGVHLGTIEPYTGAVDGATNYAYDPDVNSGFPLDGPTPTAYWGQLFFYEGSDGLSFNVLLNAYTGSPNSDGSADWDISVAGSATDPSVLLADDADTFDLTEPVANQFTGAWAWNSRTDGGVIGELSGDTWVVTIEPQSYDGPGPLTSLVAYDRSGAWIPLLLATGSAGTIVLTPTWPLPAPVPVVSPTGLALLGAALCIIAARGLRRSRG
jgi:hypothetical protein